MNKLIRSTNRKINVVQIRDSSGIYGAERVILALVKYIDKEIFNVSILCMTGRDRKSEILISRAKELGIDVIPIKVNGRLDFKAIAVMRKVMKASEVNLFHSHDFKSNFYGLLASNRLNIKRVTTAHGSTRDSLLKRAYLYLDEHIIYGYFDKIVAVSERLANQLKNKCVGSEKIQLIRNGLDLGSMKFGTDRLSLNKTRYDSDNPKAFGVIGRFYPDKGHELFLRAFKNVCKIYPLTKALIVGDGPAKNEIIKTIKELGLEENVTLCGFRSDMENIYNRIDLLVIPSFREGLPYVLLEAMASRIPVLATAVGDIPLLIKNGETGYLIQPEDPEALENGMIDFLSHPQRTHSMAEKGYDLIIEKYSAERMVKDTQKLYLSLLN